MKQSMEILGKQREELKKQKQQDETKVSQLSTSAEIVKQENELIRNRIQELEQQLAEKQADYEVLQAQKANVQIVYKEVPVASSQATSTTSPPLVPPFATPSSPPPPPPLPLPPGMPKGFLDNADANDIPIAPPLPGIPAPPPLPGTTDSLAPPPPPVFGVDIAPPGVKPKRRIKPNVAVPMLNWLPLRNIKDTIFETIDDENVLNSFDFTKFEAEFKVRDVVITKKDDKDKPSKKKADLIRIVEPNRARNLTITVRRIGMEADILKSTILSCDLPLLMAEHAALLLNFIPLEEEIEQINKHKATKDRLAEAERFMFETQNIDRYESRLRVMSYIGSFDEIYITAQPQIDVVIDAANVLTNSASFRKVLEIILAFGNYMNSYKRGAAYGFKLTTFERLLDTKSTDRRITLLHYIVQVIETHYPQVLSFVEDIKVVSEASRVSTATLATDVVGLRNGIDLVLYEREKQQNNFVIFAFYNNAVQKVAKLSERFKIMEEKYDKVCRLFNEDSKVLEPFEFFAFFDSFLKSFKKAQIELHSKPVEPGPPPLALTQQIAEKFKSQRPELPAHPVLKTKNKLLRPTSYAARDY